MIRLLFDRKPARGAVIDVRKVFPDTLAADRCGPMIASRYQPDDPVL